MTLRHEPLPKPVPVSIGSPRVVTRSLGLFTVTNAWFTPGSFLSMHRHERTTFAVMLEGSFELSFRHRRFDCPRDLVFTGPAGEQHANQIGHGGAHVMVIQPDPAHTELFRPCEALLDSIRHFRDGRIAAAGRRLAHELSNPDDVSPLAMQALGLEMLAIASRITSGRQSAPRPPWLKRVEAMIHDRFRERVALDELAAEVDIHPVHLARQFRAHHHTSIGEYVRQLRLDWATTQLANSNAPISSIALQAGFADQSHFTRTFRRRYGVTPARFRRGLS